MSVASKKPDLPVQFGVYISLLIVIVLTLVPFYWMIVGATLPQDQFFTYPPRFLPGTHFFENLADLRDRFPYLLSIWNSIFVATVYTVLSLFLCSLAGFAFAKYEFAYKEYLFYFILATVVLPVQIMIIPLFLLMANFGLLDTHIALILPFAANPVGIFLMRQSMKSIPDSWLDSARIDGASEFQLYYRIALPSVKPALAALAVILFCSSGTRSSTRWWSSPARNCSPFAGDRAPRRSTPTLLRSDHGRYGARDHPHHDTVLAPAEVLREDSPEPRTSRNGHATPDDFWTSN